MSPPRRTRDEPVEDRRAMTPAEALRRVAFLLEADGAETYKVRAFRRAAATVDATEPGRLADLAASGRL